MADTKTKRERIHPLVTEPRKPAIERVEELRRKLHLSQGDFASRILKDSPNPQGAYSKVVTRNSSEFDLEFLRAVEREYGASACWLAFGHGPEQALHKEDWELLRAIKLASDLKRAALFALASEMPLEEAKKKIASTVRPEIQLMYPDKKIKQVDRRNELAWFNLDRAGPAAQRIIGYHGLAAGPGRELERCDDPFYARELRKGAGYTYARVAGDSMLATIVPGDIVILQEFNPPIALKALDSDESPNPINVIRSEVPNDTIWMVSINEDFPTLKRITYDLRGSSWKMIIEADNREAWTPYPVEKQDNVRFLARLKGLARMSQE